MADLDGVVYVGPAAVPGAPEHLAEARRRGVHVAFVTNNASRTPRMVAEHLCELGVAAEASDVVTSAQAAAHLLAGRLEPGAPVLLLGGAGLEEALLDEGLTPVLDAADGPAAVVTGYGPDVTWRRLMTGAMLIRDGLPWVASNTDLTFPTAEGVAPGHGVQVRMLSDFSGVTPEVAGKPARPLLDETVRRVGGDRPLMVGDRLDTDIEGARVAGVDSLLVLTGVTGLAELVAAPPRLRPRFLAADLGGLFTAHPVPHVAAGSTTAELGGWRAEVRGGVLAVDGAGDPDDWWRAVAYAAWGHLDETGEVCDTSGVEPPTPVGPPAVGGTVTA
ncbi:HAD-IIA family hydrolase [Nocardioides sp. MJB4]|uniref:HAD-IIA family hydrolase n=2 Tax=Nocardioides donggukensis TaxID=2774019 RepID=A0A927K3S2_9ACTN|nr:HAD-IIA family hydrolase [Nocardioides donggukensis]